MENNITYDLLWQMNQKEKQTNELQLLPKTFYEDTFIFLSNFNKAELSDEESTIKKNTIKLLNELYERRKQKIQIYVAYKKQIPQPAIDKEQDFHNKMLSAANENKIELESRKDATLLKSLQQIPEILLPSGKKIGPLEKNQVVEIKGENEDVKFLLNSAICEKM